MDRIEKIAGKMTTGFAQHIEERISRAKALAEEIGKIRGVGSAVADDWTQTADSVNIFIGLEVARTGTGPNYRSDAPHEFVIEPRYISNAIKGLVSRQSGMGINRMIVPKRRYETHSFRGQRTNDFVGYDGATIELDIWLN